MPEVICTQSTKGYFSPDLDILYYEAHVNLPYTNELDTYPWHKLQKIAAQHKFKVSNMNGNDGHPDEETQTILTTQTFGEMEFRLKNLLEILRASKFTILRYKVEAAPIDSRKEDVWKFLHA